ncbi:META domain-containing protein [Flammeovirgaceae bacterium SG7u.132]|nr:META domain-containing protein [Flammeovirgaceae bacterium SG7u.132]
MKNAKIPSITQTKWVLETLYGDKINYGAGQAAAFMEFKEDKVNGYGGCNKFFGGYSLDGTSLDFGMLGSTKMACPTSDLEGKFMKALDETKSFAVEDGQLALKSGDATVATFKPE